MIPSRDETEASCGSESAGAPECGLFVVWPLARRDEQEILADLARRFRVISVDEVRWTEALVRRNYERFYSDLEVRGVYHEINKGSGPFLAVTVIDPRPVQAVRETSRGRREVNSNFLEAKLEYRDTRGHLGVHCSETAAETRRDLLMLLGPDGARSGPTCIDPRSDAPWDGRIRTTSADIVGAEGWSTESDLLAALGASVEHVVLGAPFVDADPLFGGSVVPQVLTADDRALRIVHTVMNARPDLWPRRGGRFTVEVGGRDVPVGLRTVGDGYIDPVWARRCLEQRVADGRGIPRPPERDDLAVRCYLALMRKQRLDAADLGLLRRLAIDSGGADPGSSSPFGRGQAAEVVDAFLSARGYSHTVPSDPTVPHGSGTGVGGVVRLARGRLHAVDRLGRGFVHTRWLAARDALVFGAPALRELVRRRIHRP